jgi:hypothetical protein
MMRFSCVRRIVKRILVKLLIGKKRAFPIHLVRTVHFQQDRVVLSDSLEKSSKCRLNWLEFGRPFVGIHMASAGYLVGSKNSDDGSSRLRVDVERFNREQRLSVETVVEIADG